MKGLFLSVAIFCILMGKCTLQNLFQYRCGSSCQNAYCYYSLGCTKCRPHYCTMFRRGKSICTPRCPRGQECKTVLGRRFCTRRRRRG